MDPDVWLRLIFLIVLLALSAFFSSAETAMMSINRLRLRSQVQEGSKKAALVLSLLDKSSRLLGTILIGNNLVNIASSSLTTVIVIDLFGNKAVGIATGILTVVVLIFCEITPKSLATAKAEKLAYRYAPFLNLLMIIFYPFTTLTNKLSSSLIKQMDIDTDAENQMTEEDLRMMVEVSEEDGVLENDECDMINNVVDFGDTTAKDIMVPAFNIKAVPDDIDYDSLINAFKEDAYSRMPVYHDTKDTITGIVWAKDILFKYTPGTEFNIKDYMREPYFTYELKNTRELMADMREEFKSMAIVLDEYGATAGLLTIEDLIEEIVGEIRDEYDTDEKDSINRLSDTEFIVDGLTNIDDINNLLEITIESDDFDSLAGYVIFLFKHLPDVGESVTDENGILFRIEATEKKRITSVYIKKPEVTAEE